MTGLFAAFWFGALARARSWCIRVQMGTMLDPKKNRLDDFAVKDPAGKILKEPHVPMLIEELNVRSTLSLSQLYCCVGCVYSVDQTINLF